jgi:hypothetical protein
VWNCDDPGFNRVENHAFSPAAVPVRNVVAMRFDTVVPAVHTPYDFYERTYLNA